jgi:hypothetical protein
MIRITTLGLSAALVAFATPAVAQDAPATAQPYVGASAGYHDVFDNPFGDDGGAIIGGVAGVDVPLSGKSTGVIAGVEANFHLGTGAVDADYGVAARLGYKFPSGGVAYVRGGWQWINIDVGNVTSGLFTADELGISDTDDDYLVGVGGEFPVGGRDARLRIGVDTVSFDTWRPTAAFIIGF